MLLTLALIACKNPDPVVPTTNTLCDQVDTVFDDACVRCHSTAAPGGAPFGGLSLVNPATVVGAPSDQSELPLVAPGDPTGSYLVHKLRGTHEAVGEGDPMPPTGSIGADSIAVVTDWISEGAACAGESDADTDADADTDTDADADTDTDADTDHEVNALCAGVQSVLDARCTACHANASTSPGALDLTDVSTLVGTPSHQSGLDLILPFVPSGSYLYRKVENTHLDVGGEGDVMPPPHTFGAMDTHELQQLEDWITLGAGCGSESDADTDADADSDTDADADSDADADTDADSDADADTDLDPRCAEAQGVIDQRCLVCHSSTTQFGGLELTDLSSTVGADSDQSALDLVAASGVLDDSYLWHKIQDTQLHAGGEGLRMPPSAPLSTQEVQTLEDWLVEPACHGEGDADTDADADSDTDADADTDADTDADADADTDADTDPPVDDGCSEVQAVLDGQCTGCHGVFAVDGLDLRDISALVGVVSPNAGIPLIEAGDEANSYLMDKIRGTQDLAGGAGVQMPPGFPMQPDDVDLLAAWIDAGATCDEPGPPPEEAEYDPNTLDQDSLFVCNGSPSSSKGRLRRMDKLQFRQRIGQDWYHPTAANPFEPSGAAAYSTYAEGAQIDVATLDLYLDLLPYAGGEWRGAASYERNAWQARQSAISCMYDDAEPDLACVDAWVTSFLTTGVVSGQPTQDEIDRLVAFSQIVLADEAGTGATRDDSLVMITSAGWLHTSALFEAELGSGTPDAHGRQRLSDHETAAMLAGLLSDRGPGSTGFYLYDNALTGDERWTERDGGHLADIATAAQDGTIQQAAVAGALIRQYAMGIDPNRADEWIDYGTHSLTGQRQDRAEEWMASKLDRFFIEFFDVNDFESTFHDTPNATTAFEAESALHYQRSLDEMRSYRGWLEPDGLMVFTDAIARVVNNDADVLRNLLTTTDFYLPATTSTSDYKNRLFNLTDDVPATREGRWNTLPPTERAGMLTHPVWLAAHGDAFENGPSLVHRGKWVRQNLFCETVPPLELVTVQAQLLPTDGSETARQRVEASLETQPQCMGCHQFMNDLGKPFEFYNHAGMLRHDDHGNAPDGSTTVLNAPDSALNRAYSDPMDFMDALGDSEHVKRCFIRQTFRFFAGRDETLEDTCVLAEMESAYDTSGGSFVSMLEALGTHDALMYRTHEEVLP